MKTNLTGRRVGAAAPDQQARAAAIAAEITTRLAGLPFALRGTVADRLTRCGYPGCRCHASPPQLHGPYHQWTRQLRELITELEALSLAIADNDPRWNR